MNQLHRVELVLLDRDDTIVEIPHGVVYQYGNMPIRLTVGAAGFIRYWNSLNVPVAVVSNQQGISREEFPDMTIQSVTQFNERLNEVLQAERAHIDRFYVCPHRVVDCCECRKPAPGLIHQALSEFSAGARCSWIIGDRESDVVAGIAAGINAILFGVDTTVIKGVHAAVTFEECRELMLSGRGPGVTRGHPF